MRKDYTRLLVRLVAIIDQKVKQPVNCPQCEYSTSLPKQMMRHQKKTGHGNTKKKFKEFKGHLKTKKKKK